MKIKAILTDRKSSCSQDAFTLPEVMTGIGVCMVVLLPLYAGISYGFATMEANRKSQRATQIVLQTFELVRLYNWDQITTPGYMPATIFANETNIWTDPNCPDTPMYTGTVANVTAPISASYAADLRYITVQLGWSVGRISCTRTSSTFVARQGLQSYVY